MKLCYVQESAFGGRVPIVVGDVPGLVVKFGTHSVAKMLSPFSWSVQPTTQMLPRMEATEIIGRSRVFKNEKGVYEEVLLYDSKDDAEEAFAALSGRYSEYMRRKEDLEDLKMAHAARQTKVKNKPRRRIVIS